MTQGCILALHPRQKSQGPFYNTRFSSLSQLNKDLQAVSKKLDQNGLEGDSKP